MAKSTLYPKSAKEIKGKTAIAELQRAHLIIVLLSFAVMPLFILSAFQPIQYHAGLVIAVVGLLAILGIASLCTIIALRK